MDLNNIVINTIYIAIIFLLSGILHELSHLIICIILKCKVKEFKFFIFKIINENQKYHLKIDIKSSEHCSFYTNNLKKVIAVMSAGPIMSFLLVILFGIMLINRVTPVVVCGLIYNIVIVISSILPYSKGDGYCIKESLMELKKNIV